MLVAMRPGRAVAAVGIVAFAVTAAAQDTPSADPLAAVGDSDPMALARVIDRLGDDAVLDRLGDDTPYPTRLAAIRSAPFMVGPELALGGLASIAAGRHPHLAPAAAQSALTIARDLDGHSLARREVPPETLADAARRFDALAADESARADLRVVASMIHAQLAAAGVPAERE